METTYREPAAATGELQSLIADVEDLVASITHLQGKDIGAVRARVERALLAAKQALAAGGTSLLDGTREVRRRAGRIAAGADSYVRESPWQAVGIAALLALAVGYISTRRD
jgi:ElaB/YqjD/DUF883 family membrane-anchored ribosome-binding protein